MTNTKFRKRALLSSVAMLLVALVALGSATFAWFTDDPNANAKGIKGAANTGLGLVVSTDTDSAWSHSAKLANNLSGDFTLVPATTANGEDFFTANAAAESSSTIKTGTGINWAAANLADHTYTGGGVYTETIKLKTTAGSKNADIKLVSVKLNTTSAAMAAAITVLVRVGTNKYFFNADGSAISKWTTLSSATATSAAPSTQTCYASDAPVNSVLFSDVAAEAVQNVEVYVFLDGDDSTVYTNAASTAELLSGVECYFTAVEHT